MDIILIPAIQPVQPNTEYLKKQNPSIVNPAIKLHLKGTRHQLPSGIIDHRELEKLYNSYQTKINRDRLKIQLFISINGSEHIKNSLLHMFRRIRKTNPEIHSPKQIRSSVITHWLKNYNLRQAQYFAGHKYVSSTERCQLNNLDSLQSKLEKCHPLK